MTSGLKTQCAHTVNSRCQMRGTQGVQGTELSLQAEGPGGCCRRQAESPAGKLAGLGGWVALPPIPRPNEAGVPRGRVSPGARLAVYSRCAPRHRQSVIWVFTS